MCVDFVGDMLSVVWLIVFRVCVWFCDVMGWVCGEGGVEGEGEGEGGAEGEGEMCVRMCVWVWEMVIMCEMRVLEFGSGIGVLGMVFVRFGVVWVMMLDANVGLCEVNVNEDGVKNLEMKILFWVWKDGECWWEVCEYGDVFEVSGGLLYLIVGMDLLYS